MEANCGVSKSFARGYTIRKWLSLAVYSDYLMGDPMLFHTIFWHSITCTAQSFPMTSGYTKQTKPFIHLSLPWLVCYSWVLGVALERSFSISQSPYFMYHSDLYLQFFYHSVIIYWRYLSILMWDLPKILGIFIIASPRCNIPTIM